MLITDSRKACFAVYQQNGMLRLWDATSGMWLRDITDSQLVTMSVTAMLFDTSLALHGKDRAEGQRSEVQGQLSEPILEVFTPGRVRDRCLFQPIILTDLQSLPLSLPEALLMCYQLTLMEYS